MKYKACRKCAKGVGATNITGNILMIVIKGYMGVVGGSKGLIADAIHSCADLLATIVMIIGLRISGQKDDEQFPYGYGKSEYIVSIVIYLFLIVIASYILYDGIWAIIEKRPVVPCMVASWGAIFSIAINELMFRHTLCAGTQVNSPVMIAKAWESRSDVYSSIAVLIGIIGAKMGFHFMDPLAAVIVGLIIFKICIEMIWGASLNLLDKTPDDIDLDDLTKKVIQALQYIIVDISSLRMRELGSSYEISLSVSVPDCISVADGEEFKNEIREIVEQLPERHTRVIVKLSPHLKGNI